MALRREAFGRIAQMGSLYDARSDKFLTGMSLFNKPLGEDDVLSTDNTETTTNIIMSDSLSEKFTNLDISAELKLSILSGLIEIKGSGKYLKDEKNSSRTKSMSLLYSVKTRTEEIALQYLKGKFDYDLLEEEELDATHVVVGIDWGAKCTIICEDTASSAEDTTQIQGALEIQLKKIGSGFLDMSGKAEVDYGQKDNSVSNKFSYKSLCDVSLNNEELPTTFEGVVQLAKRLPKLVDGTNAGKGVPLAYELLPITKVRQMCKKGLNITTILKLIDEDVVLRVVELLDNISVARQEIGDLLNDLKANIKVVPQDQITKAEEFEFQFKLFESKVKPSIAEKIIEVRSGQLECSELDKTISQCSEGEFTLKTVREKIAEFLPIVQKIRTYQYLTNKGVVYVGRDYQFYTVDLKKAYVLYFNHTQAQTNLKKWQLSKDMLIRLMNTHKDNEIPYEFFIVDNETRPDLSPYDEGITLPVIQKISDGNVIQRDVVQEELSDINNCLIKFTSGSNTIKVKPNRRVYVRLHCPVSGFKGRCDTSTKAWSCQTCKAPVEYGLDEKLFFCECGHADTSNAQFRCDDPNHGMNFSEYPSTELHEQLVDIPLIDEINILILGETGVGKSTWINAFVNYMSFGDMDDAIAREGGVLATIPARFTVTDKNSELKVIHIGDQDDNEDQGDGKSCTQEPRDYAIQYGDKIVRLIDTPGIGDVRGITQDKENMDNILAHLSTYDKIHGICILMKPNEARATVSFRFCIKELLKSLDRSASNSIAFCFTNSRATFYRPGESRSTLSSELAKIRQESSVNLDITEHNTFCMDNEAFRFLACIKNGMEFTTSETEAFRTSWDQAVETTSKLLKYVCERPPHDVKSTISLNEARATIMKLAKPMAEISTLISSTIIEMNRKREEIKVSNKNIEQLRSDMTFTGVTFERKDVNRQTVCTHKSCIATEKDDNTKMSMTIYKTVCHAGCGVGGTSLGTVPEVRLQGCAAMYPSRMTCSNCSHGWDVHMHMTYELKQVPKVFTNPLQEQRFNTARTAKVEKEEWLADQQVLIKGIEGENEKIRQISAKFALFLSHNAIVPYNDAIIDHIDYIIKQEEERESKFQDADRLTTLKENKEMYIKEKETFEYALTLNKDCTVSLSPDEIKRQCQDMFSLPHYGKDIKAAYEGIKISSKANHQQNCQKVIYIKNRPSVANKIKGAAKSAFRWVTSW